MKHPAPDNHYQTEHARLLFDSYQNLTGKPLLKTFDAKALFEAPFVVVSHDGGDDPILTYGNLAALKLWETDWNSLTQMPSRLTAEPMHLEDRTALLEATTRQGYIDDYNGIRISSTGNRFRIEQAVVWNLTRQDGTVCGQAAMFSNYIHIT
ncbi:MAG: MEKHLA domain-containing protein [Pseudoruegeria sp.]